MAGPWEKYAVAPAESGPWAKYQAKAPKPEAIDPTEGMSTTDKVLAGVGKSFVDTYEGLKQFGAAAGNKVGLVDDKTVANLQVQADERAKLDKPLMSTGAGMAGNLGGQIAQMAVPGAALGKVGMVANAGNKLSQLAKGTGAIANVARVAANPFTQAAVGGATFAATQPVLSDESRGGNMLVSAIGGGAGQGVVSGLKAIATPAKAALSPALQSLAAKAEQMGIPVNAAQLSDSKFVQTLASTLEKLPFTGAQKSRAAQQEAFNRAVGKTFGEDAPAITNEVYAGAKKRIGGEFERLSAQNNLKADDVLLTKLASIQDDVTKFGNADSERAVKSAIDELLSKADDVGNVPGKAYQSLDSKLGKLMKGGGEKSHYLGELRDAVRNAMDDSISGADQAAWKTARKQYRNMKTIRDLVAKEGSNGDISPALLAGRLSANEAGKEAMAMGGGGEMGDLARIGRQFLRDKIPDSGTAQRLTALGALGGGSYALGVDPQTALLTLAGGATVGRGMNKLMNSQTARQYMLNGAAPANRLADLLTPLPYVTAPAALNMSR